MACRGDPLRVVKIFTQLFSSQLSFRAALRRHRARRVEILTTVSKISQSPLRGSFEMTSLEQNKAKNIWLNSYNFTKGIPKT